MSKTHYQEEMGFSFVHTKEVQVIQVIRTILLRKGDGTEKDPIRRITQYWSLDGDLLWEKDPLKEGK